MKSNWKLIFVTILTMFAQNLVAKFQAERPHKEDEKSNVNAQNLVRIDLSLDVRSTQIVSQRKK